MPRQGDTYFIGDTGAMLVYGEWLPGYDPADEAASLLKLAQIIEEDWGTPLDESRQVIIEDTARHFLEQKDPDGVPWAQLSNAYLKQKIADGYPADEILVRTGRLKKTAIDRTSWFIDNNEIFFESSALPRYGKWHQIGVDGRVKGGALPKRTFIGISDECENEIEAIWLNWINNLIDSKYPDHEIGGGSFGISTPEFSRSFPGDIFVELGSFVTLGVVTDIPAFGGGLAIRGPGGRFIGATKP